MSEINWKKVAHLEYYASERFKKSLQRFTVKYIHASNELEKLVKTVNEFSAFSATQSDENKNLYEMNEIRKKIAENKQKRIDTLQKQLDESKEREKVARNVINDLRKQIELLQNYQQ